MRNNIQWVIMILITYSCNQITNSEACNPRYLINSRTSEINKEDSSNLSISTLKKIQSAYVIEYTRRNYFSRYIIGNQILITRKLSNDSIVNLKNKFILQDCNIKQKLNTCYSVNSYLNTSYNLRKDIFSPSNYKFLLVEGLKIKDEVREEDTIYLEGQIENLALGNVPSEIEEIMFFNEDAIINKQVPFELMIVKRKTGLFLHILYQYNSPIAKQKLKLLNILDQK